MEPPSGPLELTAGDLVAWVERDERPSPAAAEVAEVLTHAQESVVVAVGAGPVELRTIEEAGH